MSGIISRLETPRLVLELNSDEDPRASFCSSLRSPQRGEILSPAEQHLLYSPIQTLLFYNSPNPPSNYKVILKEAHAKIGIIGFFRWDPVGKSGSIGFSLNKQFRNQGIMTEAAQAFIQAWFSEGEMSWIEGKCQPENKASEKVLIRSGMTFRRKVEEPLFKGSRLYTLNVYGISRPEWLKMIENGKGDSPIS